MIHFSSLINICIAPFSRARDVPIRVMDAGLERTERSAHREGDFSFSPPPHPTSAPDLSQRLVLKKPPRGAEIRIRSRFISRPFDFIPPSFPGVGCFAPGSPPLSVPISLSGAINAVFQRPPPKTSAVFVCFSTYFLYLSCAPPTPPITAGYMEGCCPLGSFPPPPTWHCQFRGGGNKYKPTKNSQTAPAPLTPPHKIANSTPKMRQ